MTTGRGSMFRKLTARDVKQVGLQWETILMGITFLNDYRFLRRWSARTRCRTCVGRVRKRRQTAKDLRAFAERMKRLATLLEK